MHKRSTQLLVPLLIDVVFSERVNGYSVFILGGNGLHHIRLVKSIVADSYIIADSHVYKAGSAAVISTNVAMPCPGEIFNTTCVTAGYFQRWRVFGRGTTHQPPRVVYEKTFRREEIAGTTAKFLGPGGYFYMFVLILTEYDMFTSVVSIVASQELDSTQLECAATTRATTQIKVAGIINY